MKDEQLSEQIFHINRLVKQYDEIYRRTARIYDIPELALWILYVARQKDACTQKDVVDTVLHPRQSVHSALHCLVQKGYVILEPDGKDRRSRRIRLTEEGRAVAERTADCVLEAEQRAFLKLTAEERSRFEELFCKLADALDREFCALAGKTRSAADAAAGGRCDGVE